MVFEFFFWFVGDCNISEIMEEGFKVKLEKFVLVLVDSGKYL